jgi:hypothetical protein
MKKVVFLIIFLLLSAGLYAQNVSTQTIRWHVGRAQEINTGRVSEGEDQFVSYGITKIEWQNAQGVVKKTFTINETNGSWTNVQSNGSILYEVNVGEQLGTVKFFRTSSELTIRITLLKGDGDPDLYEFSITSLETL